ncbi:ABC transporter permease [Halovulum dunhuangense]|uniref:ABC transporter permease n=1 Tax=Halovulum dunhuangense TaxID=1505036 RepID=A0A849KZ38_9RHOB|nr:ABC transporter permease [Halovulum dunhuangense]NNU79202.1 ABC transporter permease [Halovulum dunhuangense]
MRGAFFLALAYLRHNAGRSLVLVLALALILFVPVATRLVLNAAEDQLTARAEATPLMIGARGSALDLMMNGLYFSADRPEPVSMAAVDRVWDSGLAVAIPLYVRYSAGGAPVVGTTLDYFDFRGLEFAEGRGLAVLGEAVLGARAAQRLGLRTGDPLISDPENLFDLAGSYPLEMLVVGVLAPTGTADDDAVFVDMNTAWVIEGLGHGHDDVIEQGMAVSVQDGNVLANAALTQFTRITADNIDSFHFHGAPETYPVSSVIAVPWDDRAGTILRGRYLGPEEQTRIVVPAQVVEGLLQTIFRIGRVLDAVFVIVGAAALIALGLAVFLSLRLRADEMATATRLGCHRLAIARMLSAEIILIVVAALSVATISVLVTLPYMNDVAVWLVTNA